MEYTSKASREQLAAAYWEVSKAFHNHPDSRPIQTQDAIAAMVDVAGKSNRLLWPNMEMRAANLLHDTIHRGHSKVTKRQNVVPLRSLSK